MASIKTNLYDNRIYFAIIYNNVYNYIIEPSGWDNISNRIPRDPKWYGFTSDFLEDKYGMMFTFIKSKYLTGGGEILKSIYETVGQGPNSDVFFEIGVMQTNTPLPTNRWRINLNEYTCENPGGVSTSIEKMPFQAKYRARSSAKCTVNDYANMDGDLLSQISSWQLRLHSKTLQEESSCLSDDLQTSNQITDDDELYYCLQPDQSDLQVNELSNVFSQPVGLIVMGSDPNTSGTPEPPSTAAILSTDHPYFENINQYTALYSGSLNISWQGSAILYYYINGGNAILWQCTPRVIIQRSVNGNTTMIVAAVGTTQTLRTDVTPTPPLVAAFPFPINGPSQQYILPGVVGSTDRARSNQVSGWSWDENFQNIQIESGDLVYVHIIFSPPFAGTHLPTIFMQVDAYTNQITYTQLTVGKGSVCESFRAYDIIEQMIENLTGQKNGLQSTFFSPGGKGYGYLFSNGYGIRNYGGIAYKFKESLDSFLESLQSIFCLGKAFQIINGVEKMVIEELPFFFQNTVIGVFAKTFGWKTIYSNAYCFNKVLIGFTKYEGLNLIQQDEFCTEGSYLLQFLKYVSNEFNQKSGIIASGYLLEEQRRNQFLSNPGQKLTNDDDVFIVATSEPNIFKSLVISLVNSSKRAGFFLSSMALQAGDQFFYVVPNWVAATYAYAYVVKDGGTYYFCSVLSGNFVSSVAPHLDLTNWTSGGGLNDGVIFTIDSEVDGYPIIGEDVYTITTAPTDELFCYDIQIIPPSPNQIYAERNQPFKICEGVLDPSTIYNGRLSLAHILYNWRSLFGVGLSSVDVNSKDYSVSQIVTTLVKMNSLFTTQFLETERFKGNIGDKVVTELNRIRIKDYLSNGTNIFTHTGAMCQIKIGWNEMNVIRQALCGETQNSLIDYGGIVLGDDLGNYWFCHVMDIQYNFVKQIADLKVQIVRQVSLPLIS